MSFTLSFFPLFLLISSSLENYTFGLNIFISWRWFSFVYNSKYPACLEPVIYCMSYFTCLEACLTYCLWVQLFYLFRSLSNLLLIGPTDISILPSFSSRSKNLQYIILNQPLLIFFQVLDMKRLYFHVLNPFIVCQQNWSKNTIFIT